MRVFSNNLNSVLDKKILCIFAHYEDHVVFGWPLLQNKMSGQVYLYTCTNQETPAVSESCKNIGLKYLGNAFLENGFSEPKRNINKNGSCVGSNYQNLRLRIKQIVEQIKPDYIFTHNPLGEYGHYDHKFLFELIYNEFELPILITDIIAKSSYYHCHSFVPKLYSNLYSNLLSYVLPDYLFWDKQTKVFKEKNIFTKNANLDIPHYPKKAGLWLIK